jgi:hypothetical protein
MAGDLVDALKQTSKDARLAMSVSRQSIQRTAHTIQRYEALTNLYELVGSNPFNDNGSLTPVALKKLSDFNNVDISLLPDPKFFSDLRLATIPPPSPSSSDDDAHVAAELVNISTVTGISRPWTLHAPTSLEPAHPASRSAPVMTGDSTASDHDSDMDADYEPDGDDDDDDDDDDDGGGVGGSVYEEEYDDDEQDGEYQHAVYEVDDEELAMVGIPAYNSNPESYFTSSGSLGSTSASVSESE